MNSAHCRAWEAWRATLAKVFTWLALCDGKELAAWPVVPVFIWHDFRDGKV